MKKIITIITIPLFLGLIVFTPLPASVQGIEPLVNDRRDPFHGIEDGKIMEAMKGGFLNLLIHMKDANFSDGTVLYDYFTPSTEPVKRSIISAGSVNHTFTIENLNKTLTRLYDEAKLRNNTEAVDFLEDVFAEVETHNMLNVSRTWDIDMERTFEVDAKIVVIFWDEDKSVIDRLNMIKDNNTAEDKNQPFTGDEIFTVVRLATNKEVLNGSRTITLDWKYENGENATLLRQLVHKLTLRNDLLHNLHQRLEPNLHALRLWLGPELERFDSTLNGSKERFWASFDISQLRIRELLFGYRPGIGLFTKSFAFTYLEHHMLSTLIFNDTNSNGFMDLEMQTLPGGRVQVPVSNETLYRLDLTGIGAKEYNKPLTSNDVMTFGFNFSDVQGNLLPYDRDSDSTTINPSANDAIPISFDEYAVSMHFSKDAPSRTANLKFDYIIGEVNDTTAMDGLSLCQNFFSVLINSDTIHKVNRIETDDEAEINLEGNITKRARRIRFRAADVDTAEIRMDDIPYTWNGTEQINATGQLIPISLIGVMYGAASMEGSWIHRMRGHATAAIFMYSISYPSWSGLSISHDPTFTMSSNLASDPGTIEESKEDTKANDGFTPGFEFIIVLLGLLSIPLFRMQRKFRT